MAGTTLDPLATRFRFYQAQVVRARRLGPTMTRVTLGGPQLTAFAGGGRDQSVNLFLPHPGQAAPVMPVDAGGDWALLAADETALPAVGAILEWLPTGARARAWIEVPHVADIQDLPAPPGVEVTWLVRGTTPPGSGLLRDAVRAARLPGVVPYAWVAGESATVRGLRRHLVQERGADRRRVAFSGYWRRGASEDALRGEALAGAAA
ncbi:Vibriobactin utilization protein ViuB [Micromonospora sp. MW-13]|uniref:siderophore-interacting protein n=1 Tax=Micromonospora sp. MW-13 TaxID=2094022 RepID=UPI000E44F459|nr:siderophore-interacting protein [Micromonospora sp. MW-13]RGC67699.1 Vibriobactin utilization protein ViuB [Micromonospora sp. MW-13]